MVYGDSSPEIKNIPDFDGNQEFTESDLQSYIDYLYSSDGIWLYNHDMNNDSIVDADDYIPDILNYYASLLGRSENYYSYMDKNENYIIDSNDISWFDNAYSEYGNVESHNAYKKSIVMYDNGYFSGSLNLHDTNLDLNGCALYINDCMSFTTDTPLLKTYKKL